MNDDKQITVSLQKIKRFILCIASSNLSYRAYSFSTRDNPLKTRNGVIDMIHDDLFEETNENAAAGEEVLFIRPDSDSDDEDSPANESGEDSAEEDGETSESEDSAEEAVDETAEEEAAEADDEQASEAEQTDDAGESDDQDA